MAQVDRGGRKIREGTVVSDKMDKTVVVAVGSSKRSRIYKKIVRRVRRLMAHDETNDAKLGDRVLVVESKPYSRRKRWQLAEVLVRADRPEIAAEEIDLELLGEVKTEEEEEAPAPIEAVAEEIAAEKAPQVEEAVEAAAEEPEAMAEAIEAPEVATEEAEAKAEVAEAPEAAVEEAEAPEVAAKEPEAKAEAAAAPEVAAEEPEAKAEAEAEGVVKEATEEPDSEDVEQSS